MNGRERTRFGAARAMGRSAIRCRADGGKADYIVADVGQRGQVRRAVQRLMRPSAQGDQRPTQEDPDKRAE